MNGCIKDMLSGGDLRSIGQVNLIIDSVGDQDTFDMLFSNLYVQDRLNVMRAADAVEKITLKYPEYLQSHKDEIIRFCLSAQDKEFKWHLALVLPRLKLLYTEEAEAFGILKNWVLNRKESKIVRVNALQSLFDISKKHHHLKPDFISVVSILKNDRSPSLNARLRKLKI